MMAATPATASAVVVAFEVSGFSRVVDVGRGCGSFAAAILRAVSSPSGVLYDLLAVGDKARPALAMAGAAERCVRVGGSFFELVPADDDAYLLSQILHDWDDQLWTRLLANIHLTITSDGRVLEVAVVLRETMSRPRLAVEQNVMVPDVTGGWKRAWGTYEVVFAAPGLKSIWTIPTASPPDPGIIEVHPAWRCRSRRTQKRPRSPLPKPTSRTRSRCSTEELLGWRTNDPFRRQMDGLKLTTSCPGNG